MSNLSSRRLPAVYYTISLDLAMGYHQVEMHPNDREKTAFSSPLGLLVQRHTVQTCNRTCDVYAIYDDRILRHVCTRRA